MARIEEKHNKTSTSYNVVYTYEGKRRKIFLDSKHTVRDAELTKYVLESVLEAERTGEPVDRYAKAILRVAPREFQRRFESFRGAEVALKSATTVDVVWERYLEAKNDVTKSTIEHMQQSYSRFVSYFNRAPLFSEIKLENVDKIHADMTRRYASATVASTFRDLFVFANWAVDRAYLTNNPFVHFNRKARPNHSRCVYIPADWTPRILEVCPTQSWRTLYCLWRHAGLREMEPLDVKIDDVDFANRRIRVLATKTARHISGDRQPPIGDVLLRELRRQIAEAPRGETNLIYENRRLYHYNDGFRALVKKAGLKPWPRLIQNLRASCERDWVRQGIPAYVAAQWIGHTALTQKRHYLASTEEYYAMAR